MPLALLKGIFKPESFIGSASVTIRPLNDKEILVQIFNVTSISSGDLAKKLPGNSTANSVVRDSLNDTEEKHKSNRYGNISQLYQFTLPLDNSKLKN